VPSLQSLLPPTVDQAAAYPDVRAVGSAVRRRDLPAAIAAYQKIPLCGGRWLAARAVGEVRGALALLEPALSRDAANGALRTLLGATQIAVGWRVRTANAAGLVSRAQFATFHQRLREAEQVLTPVTTADPADLAAATLRITIARGLQLGESEARSRYLAVARQDPHFLPAQRHLLRQLLPRWGGSSAAMLAFARDCVEAAPPGSANGALVAEALVEQARELWGWQRRFGRDEIREELDAAADKSVRHPDFQPGYDWVYAYNAFALAYTRGRRYRAAAPYFRRLGRYADDALWDPRPGTGFALARFNTMLFG
jgi:hypothetical protein